MESQAIFQAKTQAKIFQLNPAPDLVEVEDVILAEPSNDSRLEVKYTKSVVSHSDVITNPAVTSSGQPVRVATLSDDAIDPQGFNSMKTFQIRTRFDSFC